MPCITMYFYKGTGCPIPVESSHMEYTKKCLDKLIKHCKTEVETPREVGDRLLETIEQMEEEICKASNYQKITLKSIKKATKAWIKKDAYLASRIKEHGHFSENNIARGFAAYWNNIICKLLILKRIPNNENFGFQQISSPQGFKSFPRNIIIH